MFMNHSLSLYNNIQEIFESSKINQIREKGRLAKQKLIESMNINKTMGIDETKQ